MFVFSFHVLDYLLITADAFIVIQCQILVHRHSLREVLDAPNVMNIIKDTKAAQEVG